jgi:predicted nucleic acid-binding protein
VATVLGRPKFSWERQAILDALRGLPGQVIDPGPPHLHVLADDADNRIIECAVAARARYVVTGDQELLALGKHGLIRIVGPRDFLVEIRAQPFQANLPA